MGVILQRVIEQIIIVLQYCQFLTVQLELKVKCSSTRCVIHIGCFLGRLASHTNVEVQEFHGLGISLRYLTKLERFCSSVQ
jgi:hypothetical protein